MIDYELGHVIPMAMAERMKKAVEADPNTVQKLGGMEFQTAFTMMSQVAANHVRQAMGLIADDIGTWMKKGK